MFLGRLNGDPAKTVAALDLGGGSTQVTFAATTPSSLKQKENVHNAVTPVGPMPVYTHSFTGLGLMAARHAVVTLGQPNKSNVTSLCVNHIIKGKKFLYQGKFRLVFLFCGSYIIKNIDSRLDRFHGMLSKKKNSSKKFLEKTKLFLIP